MKGLSEKTLLVTAGAAVGILGYLAWKHREQLRPMVETAIAQGQEFIEEQLKNITDKPEAAADKTPNA